MREWNGWKKDTTLLATQQLWGTTSYAHLSSSNAAPSPSVLTFSKAATVSPNATLAFIYFAHHLPHCSEATAKLLKLMKDNQQAVPSASAPLSSNIRTLLSLTHPRYITDRPRKEKPPDPTPLLPNFSF